ncbi:hypothetical protein LX36DRAFT_302157 [Colletotrichum falcatum]|nr:hypothetical protein LX36DRAFT_302157 [Colletotrichum falcatum]
MLTRPAITWDAGEVVATHVTYVLKMTFLPRSCCFDIGLKHATLKQQVVSVRDRVAAVKWPGASRSAELQARISWAGNVFEHERAGEEDSVGLSKASLTHAEAKWFWMMNDDRCRCRRRDRGLQCGCASLSPNPRDVVFGRRMAFGSNVYN